MSKPKIYLTTTLPYINSVPHIGHSLEFIQGDALARFYRGQGYDVLFNVGTDEHGQKIWNTAKEKGIPVQEYIDTLSETWKEFCRKFHISYDNFYRTSSPDHAIVVQEIWSKLLKKGDIYKKEYNGLYCVGCESFKTFRELENSKNPGHCPHHPKLTIQAIKEENYFFRLKDYRYHLYKWITENPNFLNPKWKEEELKNLIDQAEDISISRLKKNLPWGIPVPNDEDHVIYVWFEALLNYIISCGEERWQNSIQICGPDNLRFQGVIWQGILEALNFSHTKNLLVHGTILDEKGNKMSKSTGNVIDPIDQLEKFGLAAVRYYTLAGLSTCGNSNWSEKDLIELYNSHLADDYGNLISRTLHLIDKFNIKIIDPKPAYRNSKEKYFKTLQEYWSNGQIKSATETLNYLVKEQNRYINNTEPWKNAEGRDEVLSDIYWFLQKSVRWFEPLIPSKIEEIQQALESKKKTIIFPKL